MYNNPATKPLFRLLCPLACGCLVYLLVLLAFDTVNRILEDFFNQELLVCISMSYLVLECNRWVVLIFQKRLLQGHSFLLWSLLKIFLALALTALLASGSLIFYFRQIEDLYNIDSFATELRVFNSIFLFIALLYQSYFLGFTWLNLKFKQQMAVEQEENNLLNHQIQRFHYVIHPDFLLSGLENILLKLREKQAALADEGIVLLSDIYQYFLQQQEELVPLKEELIVAGKIHQFLCRFSPYHLQIHYHVQDQASLLVPGTLVRLIESVANSQLSSEKAPLVISIEQSADHLTLAFRSNFSLTRQEKFHKMLQCLNQQYDWLGSGGFRWQENECFWICIPTLTFKTT